MSGEIHTLAGAYALDALDDLERAAVTRHLRECPACAQEVAELRETAVRLADLTATEPPARLRDAVLAEIRRTRQAGPGRTAPGRRVAGGWRRWTLAVAAAAVAIAAGTTVAVEEHRVRDAHRQAAEAQAVAAVLAAPDARLRAAGTPGGGRVTVVVSDSRNQAVAVLSGLGTPGAGHAYQLWLVGTGRPVSAGVLAAGTDHGTRLLLGVRGVSSVGVTREPAGGSATPTLPMVSDVPIR